MTNFRRIWKVNQAAWHDLGKGGFSALMEKEDTLSSLSTAAEIVNVVISDSHM